MEFDEVVQQIGECETRMQCLITPSGALLLIAQLHLALWHPENFDIGAEFASETIAKLLDAICQCVPEVEAPLRNKVETGSNLAYDIMRGEFDRRIPRNPPDELE
jgi:hypothetical protein